VAMVVVTVYCVLVTVYGFATHFVLSMILIIAATECMIYMVMAMSVIRLRFKNPDAERDFKIKGGITIPVIVILIYGVVAGFILFGPMQPEDVMDQRIALGFIIAVLLINAAYVFFLLPKIRAKYERLAAKRTPRRRRRTGAGSTETKSGLDEN